MVFYGLDGDGNDMLCGDHGAARYPSPGNLTVI